MSFSATPFTVSGSKIYAIFNSDKVWTKVTEQVKKIEFIQHSLLTKTSVFKITTHSASCEFTVEVKNLGDPLAPDWNVTTVKVPIGC